MQRSVVQFLAAKRCSSFSQVNAHLVGSPRLQFALDERERAQLFDDANMCDRPLRLGGVLRAAAAPSVAAVAHKVRLDAPGSCPPPYQCEVTPADCVGPELFAKT